MRSNVMARTLVSLAAAVGIAAGGLATAGTGQAASAPASHPVAGLQAGVLATHNFGLSSAQAKNVQRWLATYWSYTDSIDGQLGTNSWKAFQRCLKEYWGYTGSIDGDPGTNTIKALQRLLQNYGYTGAIDGDAGSGTQAAFKNFANTI